MLMFLCFAAVIGYIVWICCVSRETAELALLISWGLLVLPTVIGLLLGYG